MVDVPANTSTTETFETDLFGNIGSYSGRLETIGDHDWLRITLEAGYNYRFFLSFQETGSSGGGSTLKILDAVGGEVVSAPFGSGAGANRFLIYTPPATGTFYIDIGTSGDDSRGAYSILFDRTSYGQPPNFLTSNDDNVVAGFNQQVAGGTGDDLIDNFANNGFSALGEQGDDYLNGSNGFNILAGGLGNDTAFGAGGEDVIFGDAGDDLLHGGDGIDQLLGGDGFDDLYGEGEADYLTGGADDDFLDGGTGSDNLKGGTGDDTMLGGDGDDLLLGGMGRDIMSGGIGLDDFDFNSKSETGKTATTRDLITDFTRGEDDIDLNTIDANSHKHGNQNFKFIAKQAFHHKAGELHYKFVGASMTLVEGDINGDGRADFQIELTGHIALSAGDFIL